MKKYRTICDEIEEIEVLRETEKCVIIKTDDTVFYKNRERRDMKRTEHSYNYFDTWKEAKDFLRKKKSDELKELYERADRLEDVLQKIEAMQCPQ